MGNRLFGSRYQRLCYSDDYQLSTSLCFTIIKYSITQRKNGNDLSATYGPLSEVENKLKEHFSNETNKNNNNIFWDKIKYFINMFDNANIDIAQIYFIVNNECFLIRIEQNAKLKLKLLIYIIHESDMPFFLQNIEKVNNIIFDAEYTISKQQLIKSNVNMIINNHLNDLS
jgi:hypothetical protein